jgi:Matrixin
VLIRLEARWAVTKRLLVSVAIPLSVALILSILLLNASAHSSYYSTRTWRQDHHTGLNITWRFSPGFPTGNKRDRVLEGFGEWNGLGQNMKFERLADATSSYTFEDCSAPYHGIFHNAIDGQGGTRGVTWTCTHSGGIFHAFSIKFDQAENWNAGTTSDASKDDFGGNASHEIGHATGWSGHLPSASDSNGVCWDDSTLHTMCNGPFPIPFKKRSLEEHDKDGFRDTYPP